MSQVPTSNDSAETPTENSSVPNASAQVSNPTRTIEQICSYGDNISAQGAGPGAGGVYVGISESEIIVQQENTYYNGNITGTIERFVMFNQKIIPVEIAVYLKPMIAAAAADGVELIVNSGFRTMAEQEKLKERFPYNSATPGKSPHQRGWAVDFQTREGGRYAWLVKNAYRFGFVRTVIWERWHWEYRGTWPGQTKPEWASSQYGWSQASMFSFVKRYHRCGIPAQNGGTKNMRGNTKWGENLGDKHPDTVLNGFCNSWVGPDGNILPDYFDQTDPGWDQRGPATLADAGSTDASSRTDIPIFRQDDDESGNSAAPDEGGFSYLR